MEKRTVKKLINPLGPFTVSVLPQTGRTSTSRARTTRPRRKGRRTEEEEPGSRRGSAGSTGPTNADATWSRQLALRRSRQRALSRRRKRTGSPTSSGN